MKELVIYQGRDYTWGWDESDKKKPPQLALKLTTEGHARCVEVFGNVKVPVEMTVEEGDPERITVRSMP